MAKIIVQDEDAALLDMLATALKMQGYEVFPLRTCENAVAQISNIRPDVVILEFKIGGELCTQAATKIKMQFQSTPIIITSCNPTKDLKMKSKFDAIVFKPFDLDELYSTVERFIRLPQ